MKKIFSILFIFLFIGFAIGCSNGNNNKVEENNDTAQEKKTELNMALSVDPDGLDPHRTAAAATFQITNNIFDTLVDVAPNGEIVPGLAENWETSEDGLTITFNLREGVRFHNGREMTAEDVKFSFERLKDEESPRATNYTNIVEINVIDDYTIEFVTEQLDVSLLTNFAYAWTAIVPKEAVSELKNKPVGTGPYKLDRWIPQQEIVLTRNEEYWGKKAKIETINFVMMPDATSQIAALQSGDLDIIAISGDSVAQFEGNPNFKVIEHQYNGIQLMAMNNESAALSDVRVRQAINYAVDKKSLIETVWWGFGEEIGSHFPPMLKEYLDTNDVITYDPEKARDLLAEAGYQDGLTLEMYLPSAYPVYVDAGQVIADQLRNVGITADIHTVEWGVWLEDVYTNRQYDLTVVGHTGRLDARSWLARYQSDSGENYMNYSNERVDEILTQITEARDEQTRTELIQELQQILAEEVPGLYIQAPTLLYVTSDQVAGFESYPIDIYEMKDVHFTK